MCTQRHPAHPDWAPCVSRVGDADHPDCQFFGPNPGEQDTWFNPNYVQRSDKNKAQRAEDLKSKKKLTSEAKREERRAVRAEREAELSDLDEEHSYLRRDPHDTEVKASYRALPGSKTKRRQVLDCIIASGDEGRIDEEMQLMIPMHPNTQTPRRLELVEGGWIEESGRFRPTVGGSDAIIWVLTVEGRQRLVEHGILTEAQAAPRPMALD